jgi:tRNA A37 threonylcarbamoyladenosine modification protein TsaB
MLLYIDTSDNSKTIVGLDKDRLEKPTGPDKSQQVLSLINQILKKNLPRRQAGKKTLRDLTEIEVETGPGSFTGLRVGVSVANALAWVLKIPVNGKKIGELVEPRYE